MSALNTILNKTNLKSKIYGVLDCQRNFQQEDVLHTLSDFSTFERKLYDMLERLQKAMLAQQRIGLSAMSTTLLLARKEVYTAEAVLRWGRGHVPHPHIQNRSA